MNAKPNVLLVVLDTARADGFGPYDAAHATPCVSQLASRGTAFANAIAPSCWTVPSHASMLLGDAPRSVGLSRVPQGKPVLCGQVIEAQKDRYLPDVLRRAGYETRGVSANVWISERNGFSLGFDAWHDVKGRFRRMTQSDLSTRIRWYLDALRARADDGAAAIEDLLRTWIRDRSRAPFFWFVNLLECHSPYLPPVPYNDVGPVQRLLAASDTRRYQTFEGVLRAAARGEAPADRVTRRMRHLYDRSIVLMDDWLARILQAMDTAGILDDTLVIVTSDHGENFGEGGLIGHAGSLDDRLLRVPLVVAGADVAAADERVVGLAELPSVVASAIGLDDHPWAATRHPGVAVAQYDGPMPPDHPNIGILDEWGATDEGRERLTARFTAATDGKLKIVRSQHRDRLYDLERDPFETRPMDLAGGDAPRVEALTRALDVAADEAWDPEFPESAPDDVEPEAADIEERMKMLGYL